MKGIKAVKIYVKNIKNLDKLESSNFEIVTMSQSRIVICERGNRANMVFERHKLRHKENGEFTDESMKSLKDILPNFGFIVHDDRESKKHVVKITKVFAEELAKTLDTPQKENLNRKFKMIVLNRTGMVDLHGEENKKFKGFKF